MLHKLFGKKESSSNRFWYTYAFVCIIVLGAGCSIEEGSGQASSGQYFIYTNPNPQVEMRDTGILSDDGRFYAVGTCPPYWQGANPGVRFYSSENLIDWKFEKLLIDASKLDESIWYIDRFWAPELHKIKGKYYLTFNSENNRQGHEHFHACGVAVADKVLGPYKVMTEDKPLTPWPSNDITLYEDDNGKVYAFFNNGWTNIHKIFVAELDLDKIQLKEEPVELFAQEPGKWDGGGIEGAHVVKHEGTYYLFYSSWTRGYAVGYATAEDIRGPWKKHESNPLFGAWTEGDKNIIVRYGKPIADPNSPYTSVGHNQIFPGPDGRLWTSYHGYTRKGGKAWLLIDPIWFEDGEIRTTAPTYTQQKVEISTDMLKKFPGLRNAGKQK